QDVKNQPTAGKQLLSGEQKRQYDDQGFIVVPRLVSSTFLTQASRMDVSLTQRQRLSGDAQQKASDAMHAVLAHYRKLPEVLDWVEQFCGPRLLSLAAMFVSVPPDPAGTSKLLGLHQNSNFLPFAFSDEDRVVSVWTSLDCPGDKALVVVPGSHKGPTLVHSIDDGVVSDTSELTEPVAVDAQPGDAVFLHPRLVHGTAPNRSERYRKELISHFAPVDVHANVGAGSAPIVNTAATETYKVKEYFEHNPYSFYDFNVEMGKMRLPQPSSQK
ncbi:unnamed protein product, partial [Ixodes hexagonus]